MFPTSARVKLNRVALKDVIGLQLVPRRRRISKSLNTADLPGTPQKTEDRQLAPGPVSVEGDPLPVTSELAQPCSADQMVPENVTDASHNTPEGEIQQKSPSLPETSVGGMQLTLPRKRNNYLHCKGRLGAGNDLEVKQEGPYTRGKYFHSRPNTRSKSRLDSLRRLSCKVKLRFAWCFCADSDNILVKGKAAQGRLKPRGKPLKMSMKRKSKGASPLAIDEPTQSKTPSDQTSSGLGKSSGRTCDLRPGNSSLSCKVKGRGRGRKGQSKVETRSTGCELLPIAAAAPNQVVAGTQLLTGVSNINRKGNVHPKPTGLAGSEGSVRRAVKASSCGLCGDCKYIPSQWKKWGKKGPESTSPGPEQPRVEYKSNKANTIIQTPTNKTPEKIIIWVGKYPKVKLCDIAQKCEVCRQDCGYVLPDVPKTKVVHCFKQDLKAGVQFGASCSGRDKHGDGESALATSSESYHSVQSEKSSCQSQSLTEHQKKHPKEYTAAETFTNHATCHFLEGWTSEASANCSASFLLGKRTSKGECRTGMLDRDIEEDPGAGSDLIAAERRGVKRIKLGDSIRDGVFPPSPDLESINHNEQAKMDSGDKEKVVSGMSLDSQSCLDLGVGSSDTFDTPVKKNGAHKKPGCQRDGPGENDPAQKSSEPFSQKNGVGHDSNNTDQLELFSCQRVRVYFKQMYFSCARTYMSWPFPNSGLTPVTSAGTEAHPAEPVYPSPRDTDAALNQNQDPLDSPSEQTNVILPNATTDSSPGTNHQFSPHRKDEKGEDDARRDKEGEHIVADKKFASLFPEFKEPQASLPSEMAIFSSPREQREPGMDTVSTPSSPSEESETDTHLSTPSSGQASTSSPVGLSDWETASVSSPMLFSFTPVDLDTLSATPSSLPLSFPLNKIKGVDSAHTPPTSSSSSPERMAEAIEDSLLYCETHLTSPRFIPSSAPPPTADSFHSCESSLILSQEDQETEEEILTGRSPLKPKQHYNPSPSNNDLAAVHGKESSSLNKPTEQWLVIGTNVSILAPLLSPIASPQRHSITGLLPQTQGYSEERDGDEEDKEESEPKMLPGDQQPQMVTEIIGTLAYSAGDNGEDCKDDNDRQADEEQGNKELEQALREPQSSPSSDDGVGDGNEEDNKDDKDYQEDVEQGNRNLEQVTSKPKIKAALTTVVLMKPHSSPSSDGDDGGSCNDEEQPQSSGEEGTSPSETSANEGEEAEAADDTTACLLDEYTAYEHDILLVDAIQDDPDLFINLPKDSLLKLGPTRIGEAPKTTTIGEVKTLLSRMGRSPFETEQSSTTVATEFCSVRPGPQLPAHIIEESNSRPWRPQCSSNPSHMHSNSETMDQLDANNKHVMDTFERGQVIQATNSLHNTISPLMTLGNGPWIRNPANMTDFRRQKSSAYCRQFFSETLSCGFKICRFQHVPIEGDEKFCVETVMRFTKNPMCLQKAGAVFTGYYQNNPPGVYFSTPVLISLLWALLKVGLVSDVFSVLNVSVAHKIMPGPEFLLALFNFVREKGLIAFVPELLQLTSKMANAGLVLSLDYMECVRNTPEFQQPIHLNSSIPMSGNHKLSLSAGPLPETLNLAYAIVEIELCAKQEDWRRMGVVFRSICQYNQGPNKLEQISGRIAVALLSETKDKLSLPFATFAEMACQDEGEDSLIQSFLGRIGVSLMFRYHKTHQWAKGRRVVEVLSRSKVGYSKLKGLFGNEDRASRCSLVTVATELFLLSGRVEGALHTLRDNEWFLSSYSWPCEPGDLQRRSHVLMRLSEKTSHRDTLEVLSNLPGLKEPSDLVDVSKYSLLFNSHLQVCVDRQTLPVASDTLDFMLSKNLAVDLTLLQTLLHKLGKQNLWLRAREVFKHSLSVGYFPGVLAPPGFLALTVPCRLGEIELALTFEMFITVNATVILNLRDATCCLSITLKRTQNCEREYLSAGSRLLSAACIPQPKLTVHFTAVNSSREQVFTLDTSSARRWLRHNHLWANEVWTHSKQSSLPTTP